jgi:hypothetical protein
MSNPKGKKPSKKELVEELKAQTEPLEVEGGELTDEDLEAAAGGQLGDVGEVGYCLCKCGRSSDCGGGGGGGDVMAE